MSSEYWDMDESQLDEDQSKHGCCDNNRLGEAALGDGRGNFNPSI